MVVGKEGSEASLPHQDLYVPGKSLENSLLLYQALNEELVCWWEASLPHTNKQFLIKLPFHDAGLGN